MEARRADEHRVGFRDGAAGALRQRRVVADRPGDGMGVEENGH